MADDADAIAAVVREILAVVPAGCTWILPVRDHDGRVVDFRVAAASGATEAHGRGAERVGRLISQLYPSLAGSPLWALYARVMQDGEPASMEFRYPAVVGEARFEVTAHRVLGGVLVWWQRIDEARRRLDATELLGSLGWSEYDLGNGRIDWSPGVYRIFEREPAQGPLGRAEQAAMILAEDGPAVELSWQTLDASGSADVTVRFRIGEGVKHLRVLSHIARDAAGRPLKISAVIQDVTAREDSRSAIERLNDQLRTREMTALAEHRLAAQLQQLIQPVPAEPFPLAGLRASVGYQPAESAPRVGGDWYHAQTLPDGTVALAVGDVAGHGLEAANGMAHLRFALVAWLSIGIRDPGVLLGHMNRLCVQLGLTGTAICATYDPRARTLRWARAGHPAPLLSRSGAAAELAPPPGLLLGADPDTGYPVVAEPLAPGDLVLFYTDGLVERRGTDIAERLGAVKAALCSATSGTPGGALSRLDPLLRRPSPDDDTCTLAVEICR